MDFPDLKKLTNDAFENYLQYHQIPDEEASTHAYDFLCELHIHCFVQEWNSTSLGFGGFGGQAITPAFTIVFITKNLASVFFKEDFAYSVSPLNEVFYEDLKSHKMKPCNQAYKYEE